MVSIIIPAYNAEKYIRQAVGSALSQTCRDVEVIVVDDGSTDATAGIVGEFAATDPRVRLIREPQSGVSIARNTGLKAAGGEWICFLDSDDVMLPGCVGTLLDVARSSACEVVYGGWRPFRHDSDAPLSVSVRSNTVEILTPEEVIGRVLYQTDGIVPTPWGKLYSRRILDGVVFAEGLIYEDLDLFYKICAKVDRIALTRTPVYLYRDNPESLTNTFAPGRLDVLDVTRRIEDYMARRYPTLLRAARDRRLSANFNMLGLLAIHDGAGRYAAVADECWELIRSYRADSLADSRVRMKNKLGIIVSYIGRRVLTTFLKFVYRKQ
ncbi:MAG: glycosyltransferase [Staphylococcus sp.]|nr:glycosyltransferase [Staphylococcus sp.]